MNTTPPPPFAPPPDSPYTRRRRRRRLRRVVIGTEYGRWYEYKADTRTMIYCQRLARVVAKTAVQPRPVAPSAVKELSGAAYFFAFMGVFFGLLTVMVLIMELI